MKKPEGIFLPAKTYTKSIYIFTQTITVVLMNISSTRNKGCGIIMIMTTRFTRNANTMCIQGSAGSDHILRLEMDDINRQ